MRQSSRPKLPYYELKSPWLTNSGGYPHATHTQFKPLKEGVGQVWAFTMQRVNSTLQMARVGLAEQQGWAPLESVELLAFWGTDLPAHILQFIPAKHLQHELCAPTQCVWHDVGVGRFVMQNMEDKQGYNTYLDFQRALSNSDHGKHHSSQEKCEIWQYEV